MGFLDEAMQMDNEGLCNTDEFGETVTYTPKGGSGREIDVVINRQPVQPVDGAIDGKSAYVDVWIKNHATEGTDTLTLGGDSLTFPARVGDTPIAYDINHLLSHDAGGWLVRIWTKR